MFNQDELEKVKQEALKEHVPIVMDDTLEVIRKILMKEQPKRILEIGTAVGYSASRFVQFVPDVKVDTIEIDEEIAKVAQENIQKIGVAESIHIFVGDAVQILPSLAGKYDVIFIDANKGKYPFFLSEGMRLSRDGGMILADNILYKGYVLGEYHKHKQRTAVNRLREYIQLAAENECLETEILEVGDGLAVSRVKKNL